MGRPPHDLVEPRPEQLVAPTSAPAVAGSMTQIGISYVVPVRCDDDCRGHGGLRRSLEHLRDAGVDVVVVSGALWEAAARLLGASAGPGPALIVLSDDERLVGTLRGLSLRSWGLVPPDASAAELQAAVTAAALGLIVLAQPLGDRLLAGRVAVTALPAEGGDEPLTSREHEVLDLLGQGLSNKQIARRLAISEHTVKFHVSALYAKLGATSRTDAVSRGARRGLITL